MDINLASLPDDPATLRHLLREVVAEAELKHTVLQSAVQERDAEIDKLQLLIKRKRCGGDTLRRGVAL